MFAGEQEVEDAQGRGLAVADVTCNRQSIRFTMKRNGKDSKNENEWNELGS